MKKVILTLVLLISTSLVTSQEVENSLININWESTYTNALAKAAKENKPLLIYFTGSDWCGPCIRLDKELFHTLKFKEYADKNLILYMANFPRNKDLVTNAARIENEKLKNKYKNSFPMVLVIDKNEKTLGEKRGTYLTDYYYPFFETVVNKYYKKNPKY
ncbi:Thioredoxin-like [Tenacibaculum sp. 190524A02b]|uniref:Thioredoxin-like n=1 Tax=Tenacibaculum vairaonense TaxID=3137860 RepID=A0ABP1F7A2_9FLAO